MNNRTWACIECGKTYRRKQSDVNSVKCSLCGKDCEYVHWKIRVPSPRKKREWMLFWKLYKKEKYEIEQWVADKNSESIHLDMLNMSLAKKTHD